MTCYSPLTAFQNPMRDERGKREISFSDKRRGIWHSIKLPCGQCIGCRLERSRQWAIRCVHEAQMHKDNCFITLTYAPEHLPEDRSLHVRDFQLFMKRLRKHFGTRVRFFHCGEYGEKEGRPHYHALLFGLDFSDKYLWIKKLDNPLYRSPTLEKLWPFGQCLIGSVTFESAAYVARYITKKVTGDAAAAHYEYVNPDTGEVFDRKPEYVTMSRRSGIGSTWFQKYKTDVFPNDLVVMRGREMRPPKYYDGLYELSSVEDFENVKFNRIDKARRFIDDNSVDRLRVRETVQLSKFKQLKRSLE